ncbi:hypothetical protein HKX48_006576 [Thoreauomyces humboldtii]|nr:hypothetical protein HKX48_006576 [Thoreauomyces humboldtii]
MDVWPFTADHRSRDYEAEELEELEAAELYGDNVKDPAPVFEWAPGIEATQTLTFPALLLLGIGAGSTFLHSRSEKRRIVGALHYPSEDESFKWEEPRLLARSKVLYIYQLTDEPSTLVGISGAEIPAERTPVWAEVMFASLDPKTTIIFDSLTTHQLRQATEDTAPPLLRQLATGSAEKTTTVEYLATPSMVTGLAAAFLSWLQVHNRPGHLYLSLLEPQMGRHDVTVSTLRAFEAVIPSLPSATIKGSTPTTTEAYRKVVHVTATKDVNHMYL